MVSHDDSRCIELKRGNVGTMMEMWTVRSDPEKKVSIPRSIQFYEGGKKILIFILETGEM